MSTPNKPNRRRIAGEAAPGQTPEVKKPLKKRARNVAGPKKPALEKETPKKAAPEKAAPLSTTPNKLKPDESKRPAKTVTPKKSAAKKSTSKPFEAKKQAPKARPAAEHSAPPAPPKKPIARLATRSTQLNTKFRPKSLSGRAMAVLVAVAVLAGAFAIGPGLLGWPAGGGLLDYTEQRSLVAREPDPAEAAAEAAETIFSFRSGNLEEHREESKKLMTEDFQKEFDKLAPAMSELVPQREIAVKAETREAAVAPCGSECEVNRANVLVFLDLGRFIGEDDSRKVFANRIVMQMVKIDGTWLVDNINAL